MERPPALFAAGGSAPGAAPGHYRRPGREELLRARGAAAGVLPAAAGSACALPAVAPGSGPRGRNALSLCRTWFIKRRCQVEADEATVVIPERRP